VRIFAGPLVPLLLFVSLAGIAEFVYWRTDAATELRHERNEAMLERLKPALTPEQFERIDRPIASPTEYARSMGLGAATGLAIWVTVIAALAQFACGTLFLDRSVTFGQVLDQVARSAGWLVAGRGFLNLLAFLSGRDLQHASASLPTLIPQLGWGADGFWFSILADLDVFSVCFAAFLGMKLFALYRSQSPWLGGAALVGIYALLVVIPTLADLGGVQIFRHGPG